MIAYGIIAVVIIIVIIIFVAIVTAAFPLREPSQTNPFRVCSNLVDVFDITPQEPQRAQPAVFSGQQDARMARYHDILSKLTPGDGADPDVVEWLPSDDDTSDVHARNHHIKELSGESLVGTFADAVPRAA